MAEKGRSRKKGKKKNYFNSKSPLLDVGGVAKQGINKYSPYLTHYKAFFLIAPSR
jgi:hypothetical protein